METSKQLTHGLADLELALRHLREQIDGLMHQSHDTDLKPNGIDQVNYELRGAANNIDSAMRFVHCCLTHEPTNKKYVNQPSAAPF